MRATYRNDEEGALLHLEALLEQHRDKVDSIPASFRLAHARRVAREMAGTAAIGSAVVLALLTGFGLLSGHVQLWGGSSMPGVDGYGGLTQALIAAWVVVASAYAAGRLLAPAELRHDLADDAKLSGDIHADCARLSVAVPRARVQRLLDARERSSLALPLAGAMLLAPLTLHLAVFLFVGTASGSQSGPRFQDFDSWIAISMLAVGPAHAVLAYLAFQYAGRLHKLETHELIDSPPPGGWRAFGLTTLASLIPGGILLLIPPTLVAITGLLLIPGAFSLVRRGLIRERGLLAR